MFLRSSLAHLALRNDKYIGESDPGNPEMETFDSDARRLLDRVCRQIDLKGAELGDEFFPPRLSVV